ncbi:MAG: SDR family oxidoreductase [Acidobacteriota bacterium]
MTETSTTAQSANAHDLTGKIAVVTGGNSGIGLAAARRLAAAGARLVLLGRSEETLNAARDEIGGDTLAVRGDVTNLADLDRLYAETVAHFGKIDILVVNAGWAKPVPVPQIDEDYFDLINDINYKGAFFTVQRGLDHLNDGASIVLVSSIANQIALEGFSVYSAAKAAVRSLARSLSAELQPRGIRVNVLSPGAIETPILGLLGLPQEAVDGFKETMANNIPLGRIGHADEMGEAIFFLASPASSFVVGAELVADGGQTQLA